MFNSINGSSEIKLYWDGASVLVMADLKILEINDQFLRDLFLCCECLQIQADIDVVNWKIKWRHLHASFSSILFILLLLPDWVGFFFLLCQYFVQLSLLKKMFFCSFHHLLNLECCIVYGTSVYGCACSAYLLLLLHLNWAMFLNPLGKNTFLLKLKSFNSVSSWLCI